MENFKSMYPREIRMIQSYVSEACDRMDYQNSPMYVFFAQAINEFRKK